MANAEISTKGAFPPLGGGKGEDASKSNNFHYNKHLRNNATKAEACLWKYVLKSGKLLGYKFRRQRSVIKRFYHPLTPASGGQHRWKWMNIR